MIEDFLNDSKNLPAKKFDDRSRRDSFKKHHSSVNKRRSIVTEEVILQKSEKIGPKFLFLEKFQELDLLKEQVSCLQVRLNDVENENRNSSRKLKILIGLNFYSWFIFIRVFELFVQKFRSIGIEIGLLKHSVGRRIVEIFNGYASNLFEFRTNIEK